MTLEAATNAFVTFNARLRALALVLMAAVALVAWSGCGANSGESCDPEIDDLCVCDDYDDINTCFVPCDPDAEDDCYCDDYDDRNTCFYEDQFTADAPESARVTIANFAYNPRRLTIVAGGQITWFNSDSDAHSVTCDDNRLQLDVVLNQNQSHTVSFPTPGTYVVYDRVHSTPNLRMTVEVVQ